MSGSKYYTDTQGSGLQKRFDAFCFSVIRRNAQKQVSAFIQKKDRMPMTYLEDVGEEELSAKFDPTADKIALSIGEEKVFIDNEDLAVSIAMLQESLKNVILLDMLDHSLSEIAAMLGIEYGSVKSYKSRALKNLKRKAGGRDGV